MEFVKYMIFSRQSNILVIVAHPDDEVLGCGGTICHFSQEGCKIYLCVLGEGITSRYQNRNECDSQYVSNLHKTSKKISKIQGYKESFYFSLPDNRFDTVPILDIIKKIELLIEQIRPATIFTHHYGDLNIDHSITYRAVLTATRPLQDFCVKNIYTFEIPSSTEWAFSTLANAGFQPNTFVDISKTIDQKIKALELYTGEVKDYPHPRSPKAIQCISQKWGSTVGFLYAEPFQLIRSVF